MMIASNRDYLVGEDAGQGHSKLIRYSSPIRVVLPVLIISAVSLVISLFVLYEHQDEQLIQATQQFTQYSSFLESQRGKVIFFDSLPEGKYSVQNVVYPLGKITIKNCPILILNDQNQEQFAALWWFDCNPPKGVFDWNPDEIEHHLQLIFQKIQQQENQEKQEHAINNPV